MSGESGSSVDPSVAMSERLVRVEILLTELIRRMDTDIGAFRVDHETRLRLVESRINRAIGVALAGGGLIGTVGGWLVSWLTSH